MALALLACKWGEMLFLLQEGETVVWDLDSLLPFPSILSNYARNTFWNGRLCLQLAPNWQR